MGELGDLLMDMDELDNALFGKSTGTAKMKSSIANIDSLFGDTNKSTPKKTTVSFIDNTSGPSSTKRSTLDTLFGESSQEQKAETVQLTNPRQSRYQSSTPSSLGDLLGNTKNIEARSTQGLQEPVTIMQTSAPTLPETNIVPQSNLRIQRLENEIERLNREIDDIKRKNKEDEEDLERQWKDRMAKRNLEQQEELNEIKNSNLKQLAKLQDEHADELIRMKETYERQIQTIQIALEQSRDINSMVEKVDGLSSTLDRLATDVLNTNERTAVEREMSVRLREQQIQLREERLLEDKKQFEDERSKVYTLNAKLSDLCKGQEMAMEQDKWKVREEWNKLKAEKEIFKDDQKYIIESIEREKASLEKSKTAFFREQHDLLVRITNERQILDQEKNEFQCKRSIDVRRLKEEAIELQKRVQNVQLAENHVEELRRHHEAKIRQLQELEVSLIEECIEMENLRNTSSVSAAQDLENPRKEKTNRIDQVPHSYHELIRDPLRYIETTPDIATKNDSVRTVLKKHSEFLEKYVGQKVAAVAPRPVNLG